MRELSNFIIKGSSNICDGLKSLFPEVPIISEEERSEPFSVRMSYGLVWLVDPLDGTKEFIKGGGTTIP